jgi:hypothetical protein
VPFALVFQPENEKLSRVNVFLLRAVDVSEICALIEPLPLLGLKVTEWVRVSVNLLTASLKLEVGSA